LPYYDYGYGNYYGNAYSPGSLEAQIESQQGPQLYENSASAPIVYGGGDRELVQLYMKDGTVDEVTDYWLVNDALHFTTVDASGNATDHVVDFNQLDLQKTIDVNSDRGFRFVLRNEPMREYIEGMGQNMPRNTAPAGPMQPSTPPAPPAPAQPSAPAQPGQPQ
jgi:hypothetical protein